MKNVYADVLRFSFLFEGTLHHSEMVGKEEIGDFDFWFHVSMYSDSKINYLWLPYIHMPVYSQLNARLREYYIYEVDVYESVAVHEMGHILGLYDAYKETEEYDEENEIVTVDRCAENSETCLLDEYYEYRNIMKSDILGVAKFLSNDFEMMLKAYYSSDDGIPQHGMQHYNSFIEEYSEGDSISYKISDAIVNKNDKKKEKGKVVPKE